MNQPPTRGGVPFNSHPGPGAASAATSPGPVAPTLNRRSDDFLKELRLAEARGTGLPEIRRTMLRSGSPESIFEFDDDRAYYRTDPAHPSRALDAHPTLKEAGPMTRVHFLVAALLLAGCGEAERTRFTPATSGAKSDAPGEPSRGASEVAIPRNIETH